MRGIFISYRRDDAEGQAGRLFDDLTEHFGNDAVFMDVADIEPGRDFRRVIDEHVASCAVLLTIIGKSWLTICDASGARRLDDSADFVRLETASALRRDIPVIPVLVHGARMPRAEDLPDDIQELAFRNGVELSHARWESDVRLLINALRPYVQSKHVPTSQERETGRRAAPAPGTRMALAGVAAVLVCAAGAYVWYDRSANKASAPEPGNGERVSKSVPNPAGPDTATAPAAPPVSMDPPVPQNPGEPRFATIWEMRQGPAWQARHALTAEELQHAEDTLAGQGYRLVDLSGYAVGGQARYAAIWQKTAGPDQKTRHGLTADQYQQEFNRLVDQGYRPVHVVGYAVGDQVRFAAIWEKGGSIAWVARHDMTPGQYQRQFERFTTDGYRLVDVSGYVREGQDRYAAIWEKKTGAAWETHHGMSAKVYKQEYDRLSRQGYRPVRISAWSAGNATHYAAIWEKGEGSTWTVQHGVPSGQYQAAFNAMKSAGYRLVGVTGYQPGIE
ncbi:TIR domain-containing protein [Cupriavidus sp. P-10]|uniref:TIR domain-containing protein n=1 Tax=Cupriavidus sp. P-10 TaxID=2027911 RepID=UPI000E2E7A5C|nr:TIR domain-containing protein [Cupriavidus sp. P-10]BDB24273.1 TIR domain-containing protein [Cupriavidus sp. P-10]